MLPFTRDELLDAVASGRVTARRHPNLPLTIYNYSPEVQYTQRWDIVTLNCRGLILDDDLNIVARPWRKFFNLGQVDLPIQFDDPVEVMDKADGSLGILYPLLPDGPAGWQDFPSPNFAIATRGSFESDQAIHATKVWNENYADFYNDADEAMVLKDYTILFEIIYQSNRIVLDYGQMDDLMLLGAVETKTGYYIGPEVASNMIAWPGPVVKVMPYKSISEALTFTDRPNAEGYVIRSHNFMVKVKQPDYLDLHRLVTNVSPKTVWEKLRDGKSPTEIISAFPDEFHDYVKGMIQPLLDKFSERVDEINEGYAKAVYAAGAFASRRDYAAVFTKHPDARYYFLMLDERPIKETLWLELKPREEKVIDDE
jgi:RNA ligase